MPESTEAEANSMAVTGRLESVKRVGSELIAAAALVAVGFIVPAVTDSPFLFSFIPLMIVGIVAALHVYLLLRVDLLSFASVAFMAIGGYTMALLTEAGITNAIILALAAFLVPAIVAVPIAVIALRLVGPYFVLLSFVLAEVVYLIIINWTSVLGGSNGISGIPAVTMGSTEFGVGAELLTFSAVVGVLAVGACGFVTVRWKRQLEAIHGDEELSQSLGARSWTYKAICFVVAAGVAGLAGLLLVNLLGNAHPESFHPFASVDHVAYAVVGGTGSILGPLLAGVGLRWFVNEVATQAELAQLFYGILLIGVVMFARGGIVGLVERIWSFLRRSLSVAQRKPLGEMALRAVQREAVPPVVPRTLEVRGLGKDFGGVRAVSDISFTLAPGELIGVIGPNGAGKTTLINVIAGHHSPTRGTVLVEGADATGQPTYVMNRRGVCKSYQQTAIFGQASVGENVARALEFSEDPQGTAEVNELLELTRLSSQLNERAQDLPYGLQKMLGLVMTFATKPSVLLMDEPAAGLEASERFQVDELVKRAQDAQCGVLLVEHDMDLVRRLCPKIIVMDSGEVLAEGPTEEVLRDPKVIAAYLGETEEASGNSKNQPRTPSEVSEMQVREVGDV